MATVWAYTILRNERVILPYWLRHYGSFCDEIIIYDDQSDDGSAEIAREFGAQVRPYPGSGLDDQAFVDLARATYPEARGKADYIVWCDADEFVYHPRINARLQTLHSAGVSVPIIHGYNMLSDHIPTTPGQIYDEIKTGFYDTNYSKQVIIDPAVDIEWRVGKHNHTIHGEYQIGGGDDPLKLLHYRWLGREYFVARNQHNFSRLSENNLANDYGHAVHPGYTGDHSPDWFEEQFANTEECV